MPQMTHQTVDRAEAIRKTFNQLVDSARSDPTLSQLGRQRKIAAAWQDAETKMDGIRANFEGGAAPLSTTDLRRRLFGPNSRRSGRDLHA
jgi:hypothetical protein